MAAPVLRVKDSSDLEKVYVQIGWLASNWIVTRRHEEKWKPTRYQML
jgi:hypothetical protein